MNLEVGKQTFNVTIPNASNYVKNSGNIGSWISGKKIGANFSILTKEEKSVKQMSLVRLECTRKVRKQHCEVQIWGRKKPVLMILAIGAISVGRRLDLKQLLG